MTARERLARFVSALLEAGAIVREVSADELHERKRKGSREQWNAALDERDASVVPRKR